MAELAKLSKWRPAAPGSPRRQAARPAVQCDVGIVSPETYAHSEPFTLLREDGEPFSQPFLGGFNIPRPHLVDIENYRGRIQDAIVWTHDKGVQVVLDGRAAKVETGDARPQAAMVYDPQGKPRLRIAWCAMWGIALAIRGACSAIAGDAATSLWRARAPMRTLPSA